MQRSKPGRFTINGQLNPVQHAVCTSYPFRSARPLSNGINAWIGAIGQILAFTWADSGCGLTLTHPISPCCAFGRLVGQLPAVPWRYRGWNCPSSEEVVLPIALRDAAGAWAVQYLSITQLQLCPLSQASRTSGFLHQSVWPSVLASCRWGQHQSPPSSGGTLVNG